MKLLVDIRHWWHSKTPSIKLYVAGGVALVVGLAFLTIAPKTPYAGWAMLVAMLCSSLGVFRECYDVVVGARDRPIARLIVLILTIMSAAVATGAGSLVVSEATNQDPTFFKTAIAFISPLAFVPVFAIITFGLSILGLPIAMLMGLRDRAEISGPLILGRIFGLVGVIVFSEMTFKADGGFSLFLNKAGAYSAYILDMHEDSSCAPLDGDRIVRINDDLIIVRRITDAGPEFMRIPCPLAPQAGVLAPPKRPGPR